MVGRATLTFVAAAVLVLAACAGPPQKPVPAQPAEVDPVSEAWYGESLTQLQKMTREADDLFLAGKPDPAAALILKGQRLASRLLSVPRPTLEAMAAASDLDDLYARMLLSNRNYAWARMFYQKNHARWKNWRPQTDRTAAYLKRAREGLAVCDKGLEQ